MNKNETIADIRKEAEARFRELLEKHVDSLGHIQAMQQFNQVFDRIEAARWCEVQSLQGTIVKLNDAIAEKQELNANSKSAQIESCNGAKMREALEFLIKHKEWLRGHNLTMTLKDLEVIDRILGKAEAALAAPPRNCDRLRGDGKKLNAEWFDWTGTPDGQNADGTVKLSYPDWLLAMTAKKGGKA